jgi:hypothetical protein
MFTQKNTEVYKHNRYECHTKRKSPIARERSTIERIVYKKERYELVKMLKKHQCTDCEKKRDPHRKNANREEEYKDGGNTCGHVESINET